MRRKFVNHEHAVLRLFTGLVTKQRLIWAMILAGTAMVAYPWVYDLLYVTSTDDASIEGRHTMLAPKVPGIITEVLFDDNDEVRAGQPLVRIDRRDYASALEMTRAQL